METKRSWEEGNGRHPIPGFKVDGRFEAINVCFLLEWPTTDYQKSLRQHSEWEKKIGKSIPGLGKLLSVNWSMGSWWLDVSDGQLVVTEYDEGIRRHLAAGTFPDFHILYGGAITLTEPGLLD